jgi:hypothetical protein
MPNYGTAKRDLIQLFFEDLPLMWKIQQQPFPYSMQHAQAAQLSSFLFLIHHTRFGAFPFFMLCCAGIHQGVLADEAIVPVAMPPSCTYSSSFAPFLPLLNLFPSFL